MGSEDFFDRSEFVQYFRDETDDLLQSIDADLLRLEQFVGTGAIDAELVNSLFRALHTVKGSAGMLEFTAVQQVAHKLENVFDLLRKDRMPLTEHGVELLFEGRDVLTALVRAAIDGADAPGGVDDYVARLDAFASVYDSTAQAIEGPRAESDEESELAPVDEEQISAFEAEVARMLADAQAAREHRAEREAAALPAVDAGAAQAAVDAFLAAAPVPAPAPEPVVAHTPTPEPAIAPQPAVAQPRNGAAPVADAKRSTAKNQ